jgi:hypothetical protein
MGSKQRDEGGNFSNIGNLMDYFIGRWDKINVAEVYLA